MNSGSTEATTIISFSAVHGRLLSKLAPWTMSAAALAMLAVSSTTTGGLPDPAPMAFLPLESTMLTICGPPVATNIVMSGWLMSFLVVSGVGFAMRVMRLAGAPVAIIARLRTSTNQALRCRALGWGLKTTVLPAESMPMVLQMMVSVGLVVGVTAPMTP